MNEFAIKPFTKGVLKDIPPQLMPTGGLTEGLGIIVKDGYIERRKGFRRLNDCEQDEYILGITQFQDVATVNHLFFGDMYYLYKISFSTLRYWDDGYVWWDRPNVVWDPVEAGTVYRLSPSGQTQVCPAVSASSSSSSESSSSCSSSSSSTSSESSSSSMSCTLADSIFTGRDHRTTEGETSSWIFAPWGNNVIATNYEDPIVMITGPGFTSYQNLTCSGLHARIVDVFQGHVMALNTIDALDGAVQNRYWWSGLDDATEWDYDDPAVESGFADLPESPLPITGGARIRDSYVIFQPTMMHLLNYVGGTLVFSRQVINNQVGSLTKGLVCSSGDMIYFFGQDDIYKFDGYTTTSIGAGNNDYIFGGLNIPQVSRAFSFIDSNTSEAHFIIPFESDVPNLDCIYNFANNTWTFDNVGATAGCPRVGLEYPIIARTDVTISSSSSSSSMSSSSSSSSTSSSSSSTSSSSTSSSSTSSSSTSSSSSSSSTSSSSSSQSYSEAPTNANSYLQEVGVTDNDDDWARTSQWITGEYTFGSDMVKALIDITVLSQELSGDVHISVGVRNHTDDDIAWTSLPLQDEQQLFGIRSQGVYISFKVEASSLDDYYKVSEILGRYRLHGRR